MMAAQIIKLEKEQMPPARFIGRRYGMEQQVNGSFSHLWASWFAEDLFAPLEALPPLAENQDSYVALMRMAENGPEYWIGMFFPLGTEAPAGYAAADLPAMDYAVAWLYGDEQSGELYTMHEACVAALEAKGFRTAEPVCCFERYVCPRFTTPDQLGKVILDYGIAVE